MSLNFKIFETPQELSITLADQIIDDIDTICNTGKKEINIAISGGSTPKLLFNQFSMYASDVWQCVNLFWVDERCVPPDDEQSNFGIAQNLWLRKATLPPNQVNRMKGEQDPKSEAERYGQLLLNTLPLKNGLPYFDIVLLGMGDDGHTASLFPDRLGLIDEKNLCLDTKHPQSGQNRLTLSYKMINNADKIYFHVTGQTKAQILRELYHNDEVAKKYPVRAIRNTKNTIWYVDRRAASMIDGL